MYLTEYAQSLLAYSSSPLASPLPATTSVKNTRLCEIDSHIGTGLETPLSLMSKFFHDVGPAIKRYQVECYRTVYNGSNSCVRTTRSRSLFLSFDTGITPLLEPKLLLSVSKKILTGPGFEPTTLKMVLQNS